MEKEKIIEFRIKKKFKKDRDFKQYYVTGALGGFRNPYDFRLTFYNVNSNEFVLRTQNLKENKKLNDEELKKTLSEMEMPHILQCELIMTDQAVRELYNFLEKELKIKDEQNTVKTYIICRNCGEKFESPIQVPNLNITKIEKNTITCPFCNKETLIGNDNMVNE